MTRQAPAKVVVIRCESYAQDDVDAAVMRGLALLGGASAFIKPAEKILLKPNMLVGDPPAKNTTVHPAVFKAVAQQLQAAGAHLSFGDSPAFGSPALTASLNGFTPISQALDIPLADFTHAEMVVFPEGRLMRQFSLAKGVLAADGVISLCKMKTHALTRVTGAIKNLFGCIPGITKTELHATLPDEFAFAQMLVDLARLVNPRLCIMDGIQAMEGNGPRNGTTRAVNVLLFSDDPVAMDAVMCRIMALDPQLVPTLTAAQACGYGQVQGYQLLGDDLESFILPDFNVNRRAASTTGTSRNSLHRRVLKKWVAPRPVIDAEKCTRCGQCVKICPAKPKAVFFKGDDHHQAPQYDYERCIRCYCCQETCPHEAITVETPLLGRLLKRQ